MKYLVVEIQKLDTHNGYAEKLTEMDKNLAVITERIKNIKEVRA